MKLTAFLVCFAALSVEAQTPATSLSGRWMVTADFYAAPRYINLELQQTGEKVTGKFGGDPLEGTVAGGSKLHFVAKDKEGDTNEISAELKGGLLAGTIASVDAGDPAHPLTYGFSASLVPARPTGPAQRHEFTPTVFHHTYSALNAPVLTVNPGDTIHTTTVDAGGNDEKDVKRTYGGNPQTGPFYVRSAMPGDTLVVHIVRLRLNRDSAGSDDGVVESALNSGLAVRMKDTGKSIPWRLDVAKGTATPMHPAEHLGHYTIPLRPMLGCVATAVRPASAAPNTGDSGSYGGNMDFNEIVEGTTLYLPVVNPGALLYLGDAHAAMGDGEINGNGLETSADVEFTVDVIPGKNLNFPRVETATHIMTMGYEGSLDDAFRGATSRMAGWLADDYKLTPSEIAQVIGSAAEYRVSEVADRNSGIVLKIDKERLKTIDRGTAAKP